MARKKDKEITEYKLKNGEKYFRLKLYLGINPETGKRVQRTISKIPSRKQAEEIRKQLKAKSASTIAEKDKIKQQKRTVTDVYNVWIENLALDVREIGRAHV